MPTQTTLLIHHGAAANSNRHLMDWWVNPKSDTDSDDSETPAAALVYAAHSVINVAYRRRRRRQRPSAENLWSVSTTLRPKENNSASSIIITCVTVLPDQSIVCGDAGGTVRRWQYENTMNVWSESCLMMQSPVSITHVHGTILTTTEATTAATTNRLILVTASSQGAHYFCDSGDTETKNENAASTTNNDTIIQLTSLPMATVHVVVVPQQQTSAWIFLGSALPRHNAIRVYQCDCSGDTITNTATTTRSPSPSAPRFVGQLLGHEDWVTALSMNAHGSNECMLASGSQDCRIRLWKFATSTTTTNDDNNASPVPDLVPTEDQEEDNNIIGDDDDEISIQDDDEGEARLEWTHSNHTTLVTLEALLYGHEEGVTSVSWHKLPTTKYNGANNKDDDWMLLSSSMDRAIFLWSSSSTISSEGVWMPVTRVGSAGGILGGSVGSTLLGYCGAVLRDDILVGHAYGGSLHVWDVTTTAAVTVDGKEDGDDDEVYDGGLSCSAVPGITGHFGGVTDLCWEASRGAYLITTSTDQTCRLWAELALEESNTLPNTTYVEVARPQVHGYGIMTGTSVSTASQPHVLVTGSDEKELRLFSAPKSTLDVLRNHALDYNSSSSNNNTGSTAVDESYTPAVERAYVPSLGLSNKANPAEMAETDVDLDQVDASRLPLERDLGAVSVWPETGKLFGHGAELYRIASTRDVVDNSSLVEETAALSVGPGEDVCWVASATKARDPEAAAIRIWDVTSQSSRQVLSGHKSTVAALCFSCRNAYLISSGKDRRLCVWQWNEAEKRYSLLFSKDSAHKRIVWSVHACPFDESLFCSGSRDGAIKVWSIHTREDQLTVSEVASFTPSFTKADGKPDAVTALSFAPVPLPDGKSATGLAVGLESGRIELWRIPRSGGKDEQPALIQALDVQQCHAATVTKLAWRPHLPPDGKQTLASCSSDHGCRIFHVQWN